MHFPCSVLQGLEYQQQTPTGGRQWLINTHCWEIEPRGQSGLRIPFQKGNYGTVSTMCESHQGRVAQGCEPSLPPCQRSPCSPQGSPSGPHGDQYLRDPFPSLLSYPCLRMLPSIQRWDCRSLLAAPGSVLKGDRRSEIHQP